MRLSECYFVVANDLKEKATEMLRVVDQLEQSACRIAEMEMQQQKPADTSTPSQT